MDGFVILVLGVALYFVPTIVAKDRKVPNFGSVAVINIFLGWTLVGWVIALAMAVRSVPPGTHAGSAPSVRRRGFWWLEGTPAGRSLEWLGEKAKLRPEGTPSVPSATTDQTPSRALDPAVISPPGTDAPIAIERQGASLSSPPSASAEFERLADLHARGVLTDEEFQQAKQQVLRS